ncbi:MAG: CRISPR-associated protein Cas1 [Candidatus Magnetoglobus multicellularis str. Araruama]|uniref:CRISPR-associated endonuclease Cas1 n=1 Tax=Candidatus Magnetoglobus multicellularis str. Araruama TaxID=890399 RepID=A0A1V1PFY6_9BACT|nr:MAG: CRISPR-associated protein Cas1 [Candidatus Magnetoglobus multicellularis str. Araruama]
MDQQKGMNIMITKHVKNLPSKLVVNTPGSFIGKTSRQIVVRKDRKKVVEYPSLYLKDIIITGKGIALSSDVIEYCASNDIPILFISPTGKTTAMFTIPYSSCANLGILQLQALQKPGISIGLASKFIYGKINNQINLLQSIQKNNKSYTFLEKPINKMKKSLYDFKTNKKIHSATTIFNIEAMVAKQYWYAIKMIFNRPFQFNGRHKQHAGDLVNSMLNYGYAILEGRVRLGIIRSGLNAEIGFLHAIQKGRASLVFDLMEEFRTSVVDQTVFALLNQEKNLSVTDKGRLSESTKTVLINAILNQLNHSVRFFGKKQKIEEIIENQAISIAKYLSQSQKYHPFIQTYHKKRSIFGAK